MLEFLFSNLFKLIKKIREFKLLIIWVKETSLIETNYKKNTYKIKQNNKML